MKCSECSRPLEPRDLTFRVARREYENGYLRYGGFVEEVVTDCHRAEVVNDNNSPLTDDQVAAAYEREQERTERDEFGE
jgi:hypothetical protein